MHHSQIHIADTHCIHIWIAENRKIEKDTMIMLNLCHVILTFTTKHRFSKTVLQLTYTDQHSQYSISEAAKNLFQEGLTLAILHLLIGLCLYIGGPLNQLLDYFLTETTK